MGYINHYFILMLVCLSGNVAKASDLGLILKTNKIVKIVGVGEEIIKFRVPGYRKINIAERKEVALAVNELNGIEKFERVLFEINGKLEISRVGNVFENGLVQVSKQVKNSVENKSIIYLLNQERIINNVEEFNGYRVGEKACFRNRLDSYPAGTCGKINRIYENGYVEIITLDLNNFRANREQYDFLLPASELLYSY